ncbi:MAG: ABC transporter permease [Lachnospiraceae bacterium]|nr:ABC transporter permease [Lachnospiraceae bacterium]
MNNRRSVLSLLGWTALAFVLGMVVCFSFLPLMGVNAWEAFKTMFGGVFADTFTMGNILVKMTPLILTGLAFAFTFKANLYNIGAQGQFYVGCICAAATSLSLADRLPAPLVIALACLTSMLGGAVIGFIIGFLKAKFNANEFLVSMMSTYVIIYIMQLLLRTVLQESKHEYIKTDKLPKSVWLPKIISGTSVSLGIVFSIAAAIIVWIILYKTTFGFRIRVTGMNMEAARLSGINTKVEFMAAFAISGAIAGLAGFAEVNGMQHMLLTGLDSDVGSYGIGIAIMADANPIGVIFSAMLFGILQVGGTVLSHSTDAPASIIDLMLGFVMLFVLISFFFRRKTELARLKKKKAGEE